MPTVIDTSHLKRKTTIGESLGALSGAGLKKLLELLLEGRLGQVPSGPVAQTGNVRNLQLPGGQQFSGAPGTAQRLIPGFIQNLQQQANQGVVSPSALPQGFSVPTRLGIKPDLSQ